jgi:hypothetical protein
MSDVVEFTPGGYRFIKAVFQYSGGVAAMPGYRIVRVQFSQPVPLADGFARIETVLKDEGRPLTAICACELRSPAPFTEANFFAFNEVYAKTLQRWSVFDGQTNPVARSNVCPAFAPPAVPSFHAFAYTERADTAAPSFIVAGGGEAPEGKSNYRDHTVRLGDTSPEGMREKVRYVLGAMEARLSSLGFQWRDTTATQVYTVHDFYPMMANDVVARGAAHRGITWHYCRPPIADLDFEMDCRGVQVERLIQV